MSSKSIVAVLSVVAVLSAFGCSTGPTRAEYDTLKTYNDQLEKENADLHKDQEKLKALEADLRINQSEKQLYDQLANELTLLLKGMKGIETTPGEPGFGYDPNRGVWTLDSNLLFESGKSTISAQGKSVLKAFADKYRTQGTGFRIVGHTDRDAITHPPTVKENLSRMQLELGMHRAVAVAAILHGFGIHENRMYLESQGNNQPIAPNDNRAENKRKNRRVEIWLVPAGGTTPGTTGKTSKK